MDLSNTKQNPLVTFIAEGPETGLSIFQSMRDGNVKITLGKSNFKHPNPQNMSEHVVLCLDNDGGNPQAERLTHEAAKSFLEKDKQVWIAMPGEINTDYNDVLKSRGEQAVKDGIGNAVPYEEFQRNEASDTTLKSEVIEKKIQELATDKSYDKLRREQAHAQEFSTRVKEISSPEPVIQDKGMEQEMV